MVSEIRYQVRWDVYGALAAVKPSVGDSANHRVWCFLDYNSYNVQIGRNGQKFYCTFNYFQLLNLHLSLDCELPNKKF